MQLCYTLALCVSVFAVQALGLPRATPESDALDLPNTNKSEEERSDDGYSSLGKPLEEQKRFSRDSQILTSSRSEGRVERGLETDVKASETTPNLKVTFPEDSKIGMTLKEDDDSVRSKKSTSAQETPHFTTVCIQVRSEHPSIVCGPQVDDGKDQKFNPAARSSMGENDFYRQQLYGRSSQAQGHLPSQFRYMQDLSPKTIPASPAKGPFKMMRSEDTSIDAHPSAGVAGQPGRGGPQPVPQSLTPGLVPPSAQGYSPVNVHNIRLQPGSGFPFPYSSGISSAFGSQNYRLNCVTEPLWGGSLLRSAGAGQPQPQLVQIGDQVVAIQERPSARMAQDSLMVESPGLFLGPRAALAEQIVGLPFGYSGVDSMAGSTFIGEDGHTYFIDESQARAASEEQAVRQILELQNFQRSVMAEQSDQQAEQLKKALEKAKKLQEEIDKMRAEPEKQQKEHPEHQQEDQPEKKKTNSNSPSKRQAKSRS